LQSKEIHREEADVKASHEQPEEPFSDAFVQFVTEHFRIPEDQSGETCKHSTRDQHIVEVRYEEVCVVILIIRSCHRKHNARNTADDEVRNKCKRPQHRRCDFDSASMQRQQPVKDFNPKWQQLNKPLLCSRTAAFLRMSQ